MDNNIEEFRKLLDEVSTEKLDEDNDFFDKALLEIIAVERRYLYGLDKTSDSKRRDKIQWELDDLFEEYSKEVKNVTEEA